MDELITQAVQLIEQHEDIYGEEAEKVLPLAYAICHAKDAATDDEFIKIVRTCIQTAFSMGQVSKDTVITNGDTILKQMEKP